MSPHPHASMQSTTVTAEDWVAILLFSIWFAAVALTVLGD